MRRALGHGASPQVRRRADVAHDAPARQLTKQGGVLGGADAVCEANGAQGLERLGDGVGTGPLTRVRDRHEAHPPRSVEGFGEVARWEGRFLAAKAESHGARPGILGVEVEDALGRRGAPVPDDVEEDEDPAVPPSLVLFEDGLERRAHLEPVEAELLGDGRRNVDLGVADALAVKARREGPRHLRVVRRRADLPADVAVEREESLGRAEPCAALGDRGEIRENGRRRAAGETDEGRSRNRALEVQVELDGRREPEPSEEGGGGRSEAHAGGSYGLPEAGPLGTPPRERLWMRAAAFGVDLLLVAGGPFVVSSGIVLVILAVASEPPAGLDAGFRAAQAVAGLLFLFRDAAGGSPGKKLFGLRLVLPGSAPAGPLASVTRNLLLLIPGWNLVEIAAVIRRRDGRRPGDRLAGTTLVEA